MLRRLHTWLCTELTLEVEAPIGTWIVAAVLVAGVLFLAGYGLAELL